MSPTLTQWDGIHVAANISVWGLGAPRTFWCFPLCCTVSNGFRRVVKTRGSKAMLLAEDRESGAIHVLN